ncbi:hypothetical protein FYM98_04840 [Lactobacillus salivarius]|nr:hypothetical protein [Ligilactobacillus salivarius]MYU60249.1 hypothetical protein [Ligilactobacillus salivarius]MYU75787.1 hypothetical protein [Ligilactobacillus salivarius]MYU83605.1 hypothetical protein [Ligilactobacillus salivarius]MYU85667.1 hypothetical protein [Ligilactobacillus salivarius]
MFLEFTGRRSFATPTCVFCDILSPSFSTHILNNSILNYKLFQVTSTNNVNPIKLHQYHATYTHHIKL